MVLIGDVNVAPSQRDLHASIGRWEDKYSAEERGALAEMLAAYPDLWRRGHPDADDKFTVWDERTSARPFNVVRAVLTIEHVGFLGMISQKLSTTVVVLVRQDP